MKNLRRILVPACSLLFVALLALTVSRVWEKDTMTESNRLLSDSAVPTSEEIDQATKQKVLANYGKLPMRFEANDGQFNEQVKFVTRGHGYTMFLTKNEAVLSLRRAEGGEPGAERKAQSETGDQQPATSSEQPASTTVRMKLVDANPNPAVAAQDELTGKSNYFKGNDRSKWRTDVLSYKKVHYDEVYEGIDVVYYGNQQRLEYDFMVAPGANPDVIRMQFDGLVAGNGRNAITVAANGDLLLRLDGGEIRQQKPFIYQEFDGERHEIDGAYEVLADNRIGFAVADYNADLPLVIDPILFYSTYLGGTGVDQGNAIAVDGSGRAYVTGFTGSTDFPTANEAQGTFGGGDTDAFITKFNPAGTGHFYSTYLGGSGFEFGNGIAVDGAGNAYIAGITNSLLDFPTASPEQGAFGGGNTDAFVARLNSSGALDYSTYLGGSGDDEGYGIAVDGAGSFYVTGQTSSTDFPITNPAQSANGGINDAFVAKFNSSGLLDYSTYHGGSVNEDGRGIAVDGSGNAYVTGFTVSADFPTVNPLQGTPGGGADVFLTRFSSSGSRDYSTYLGGTNLDFGNGIALDGAGNAYIAGLTQSSDFPTMSAVQGTFGGGLDDAFVTKFNSSGSALIYSTFLGGSGFDEGRGIAVDGAGNAYVTGSTNSTDFPTTNAVQATFAGGGSDAFVTKFNSAGSAHDYSTYLGGSTAADFEGGLGIAVDGSGNAYIAGGTGSTDFPTANAQQGTLNGIQDAFVTKIGEQAAQTSGFFGASYSGENGLATLYSIEPTTGVATPIGPIGFQRVSAMACAEDGTIFATGERDADTDNDFPVLLTIDPTTGAGTEVGLTGLSQSGFDISFRNGDGTLFLIAFGTGGASFDLYTVDTGTGATTNIGNTFFVRPNPGNGIAFSAADDLFHANDESLNTLDQNTGAATQVALLDFSDLGAVAFPRINAMTFDPVNNLMYGIANTNGPNFLVTIDLVTGVVTNIGQTAAGMDALAICVEATAPEVKPYVLLAEEDIDIYGHNFSEGDIHANSDIDFYDGNPSTHTGNLTAVDDIRIREDNTINGDVTAGDNGDVDHDATVTGTVTEHTTVAKIPLPTLSFTAGGDDIEVEELQTLSLPPGSYDDVEVEKGATLILSHNGTTGEYFLDKLLIGKKAFLSIDASEGPVIINVVDELEFDRRSEVIITSPAGDSRFVTFNSLDGVTIEEDARVLGNIIVPEHKVKIEEGAVFKGAICAEKIEIEEDVIFVHHSSTTPLPKSVAPELTDEDDEVSSDENIVDSFALEQNYPNPFNPTTVIRYQLPAASDVKLSIYNMMGQLVKTLVNGEMPAGQHSATWNATDDSGARVATGVYLYVIRAGDFVSQRKLILMK